MMPHLAPAASGHQSRLAAGERLHLPRGKFSVYNVETELEMPAALGIQRTGYWVLCTR